jgi:hypothetical protein
MAKLGSSLNPTPPPPQGRRLGSSAAPAPSEPGTSAVQIQGPATLAERLEKATLAGALTAVPPAYADGQDWETVRQDDAFARLYLASQLHEAITNVQVATNLKVLTAFWEQKRVRLISGNKDLEDVYGPGTINKAQERLEAAATALADVNGRAACYAELTKRRREKASAEMGVYMRPLLANSVMSPSAIKLALSECEARGFTLAEGEDYMLASMRQAGFAPVKTVNQSPNLLLATWTPGGTPLTGQAHTKVMGHDVYTLAEAAIILYDALIAGDEKAARNLDNAEYLTSIAQDLKENDARLDLQEIMQDRKLNQTQKRLSALYLLGPALPFNSGMGVEAFGSPRELIARAAKSYADFQAGETAFKAGLLQIWLKAAATAEIKAAITDKKTALDFRKFLHTVSPAFPLWVGESSFATTSQLVAYIKQDENTWKMVYGSLAAGNLAPWLQSLGRSDVLARPSQATATTLGSAVDINSEMGRQLAIQALLEGLDPQAKAPSLQADVTELALTGLSGEEIAERTLTLTNPAGGYQRVFLALQSALDGVSLSHRELFFDQRAPGQQLTVTVAGNAAAMPRDGRHTAPLMVRSAYHELAVPITAEAVFPFRLFALFVGGAALALAVVFGAVRYVVGLAVGENVYQGMVAQGTFLSMDNATQAGDGNGFVFLLGLLALGGLTYLFIRVLARLSKPKYAAA